MDLGRLADIFVKLAAMEPPPGYEPLPAEDPNVHQLAKRLLPKYWTSPLGTLIPFTINNIEYVARIESHGPEAPKAITAYVKAGVFSPRTRRNLSGLNPIFKNMVLQLLTRARAQGMNPEVVQGRRTQAEQQEHVEKGTGSKISLHPHGLAVDIAARDENGKVYFPDRAWYSRLATIAKSLGMWWAGDWGDDLNHFQYPQTKAQEVMAPKPMPAPTTTVAPAIVPTNVPTTPAPVAPASPPQPTPAEEAVSEFNQLLPELYWT